MSHEFRSRGESEMLGAGGQKRVPEAFLKNWSPVLPPVEDQRRITHFLDEKITRIDALIEKKRALLNRLAEKRQALITQAVSQGLNPDAPRKSSGIDWLGDIPSHWRLVSLRRLASCVFTGRTPPAAAIDAFTDGTINWFTPGDYTESIRLKNASKKVSIDAAKAGHIPVFPANTILLVGIGATLGKVAVTDCLCSANQQINAIIVEQPNDPYFLAYYLLVFRDEIRMLSNGNTLGILNQEKTCSLTCLLPPPDEQKAIARVVMAEDRYLVQVERKIKESLQLLVEYRAALVNVAVTGASPPD